MSTIKHSNLLKMAMSVEIVLNNTSSLCHIKSTALQMGIFCMRVRKVFHCGINNCSGSIARGITRSSNKKLNLWSRGIFPRNWGINSGTLWLKISWGWLVHCISIFLKEGIKTGPVRKFKSKLTKISRGHSMAKPSMRQRQGSSFK